MSAEVEYPENHQHRESEPRYHDEGDSPLPVKEPGGFFLETDEECQNTIVMVDKTSSVSATSDRPNQQQIHNDKSQGHRPISNGASKDINFLSKLSTCESNYATLDSTNKTKNRNSTLLNENSTGISNDKSAKKLIISDSNKSANSVYQEETEATLIKGKFKYPFSNCFDITYIIFCYWSYTFGN